jgi:hypothetical protein
MVKHRITDGKRIAQLLASELTGLRTGGLDAVSVEQAEPDAMPSDTGTLAYRIVEDGTPLASVSLYPSYAEVEFVTESGAGRPSEAGGREPLQVTRGADVKTAVDRIRETVDRRNEA